MKKTFMGIRLRRFREERGLTQVALARALELSPSYLNQLEQKSAPPGSDRWTTPAPCPS